jgi:hypothetical protein
MLLIPLVLGEMEGDPAYEPPQGIFLVQIRPHAFPMSIHFETDPGIQLKPRRLQGCCIEILQTSHRRSFEHDRGQLFFARWCNQLSLLPDFGLTQVAKLGEVPLRKTARESECWPQRGFDLAGCEV